MASNTLLPIYDLSNVPDAMGCLIGKKGAGLASMLRAGIPVPPGFVVAETPPSVARQILQQDDSLLRETIWQHVHTLENRTRRTFGGQACKPLLLLAVRGDCKTDQPLLKRSVLNLGLNPLNIDRLAVETGSDTALRCYRRFLQHYCQSVLERPCGDLLCPATFPGTLEQVAQAWLQEAGKPTGSDIPMAPIEQLWQCLRAFWFGWSTNASADEGTALVVQSMAMGDGPSPSGAGLFVTRHPLTGLKQTYGYYRWQAQGAEALKKDADSRPIDRLAIEFPDLYSELMAIADALESLFHDALCIEFTIERGKLYVLQANPSKRTLAAAERIETDLRAEGKWP